jgi:aminomethyltransferase
MENQGIRRTPLYEFHARHGAKFVDFAGWEMPVQYDAGILKEHLATRQDAGLFDVSHMGEFLVSGDQATSCVDQLITNDLAGIAPGQAVYSPMCNESGGVVDDLILYKISETSIFICCNASNTAKVGLWLETQLANSTCKVEDQSGQYAQLAVQGPNACGIIGKFLPEGTALPNKFRFLQLDILGTPCLLSRTGYTGEDGVEIYLPPEHAESMATSILDAGASSGLVPVGLGARDSLRLEAGFPLFGHEISETRSPLEGGIGWTVKFNKPVGFVGKERLHASKKGASTSQTFHFVTQDKRIAREGTPLFLEGVQVGHVLSGSFSPILQRGIGSASLVHPTLPGPGIVAKVREKEIRIFPAKPPLHKTQVPSS